MPSVKEGISNIFMSRLNLYLKENICLWWLWDLKLWVGGRRWVGGGDGGAKSRHHRGPNCRATQGCPEGWNIVDDDKSSSDGNGK